MSQIKDVSQKSLTLIEDLGLFIIAVATIIAIGFEVKYMIAARVVTLADLLLMFIYLEVLAMVSIYLDSGKLPVRMPLYIAIVALARHMILDMKNLDTWRMLGIAGAALLIAFAVRGALESGMSPGNAYFFTEVDPATDFVTRAVKPGDIVLVKGSRGTQLDRMIRALKASYAERMN